MTGILEFFVTKKVIFQVKLRIFTLITLSQIIYIAVLLAAKISLSVNLLCLTNFCLHNESYMSLDRRLQEALESR